MKQKSTFIHCLFIILISTTCSVFSQENDQFTDLDTYSEERDGNDKTSSYIKYDKGFKSRKEAVEFIKELEKKYSFSFRKQFKKFGGRIDRADNYVATRKWVNETLTFPREPEKMVANYYSAGFTFGSEKQSEAIPKSLKIINSYFDETIYVYDYDLGEFTKSELIDIIKEVKQTPVYPNLYVLPKDYFILFGYVLTKQEEKLLKTILKDLSIPYVQFDEEMHEGF